MEVQTVVMFVGGVLISIIGWFLRAKDAQQEREMQQMREHYDKQIAALWVKHDADASRLEELVRHIDRAHYTREELDKRFDKLETSLTAAINSVGLRIDKLHATIELHIQRDEAEWRRLTEAAR